MGDERGELEEIRGVDERVRQREQACKGEVRDEKGGGDEKGGSKRRGKGRR